MTTICNTGYYSQHDEQSHLTFTQTQCWKVTQKKTQTHSHNHTSRLRRRGGRRKTASFLPYFLAARESCKREWDSHPLEPATNPQQAHCWITGDISWHASSCTHPHPGARSHARRQAGRQVGAHSPTHAHKHVHCPKHILLACPRMCQHGQVHAHTNADHWSSVDSVHTQTGNKKKTNLHTVTTQDAALSFNVLAEHDRDFHLHPAVGRDGRVCPSLLPPYCYSAVIPHYATFWAV